MPKYQWFEDQLDLSDFIQATDTTVTDDEFRTVERYSADKGEMVALGQGTARNQTDAVGRLYFDAKGEDADGDGAGDALAGKVRFVVLNSQDRVVDVISQHQLDAVRSGANDRSGRRPFPRRRQSVAEPYKLGVQVKLASGTDTYDNAGDSSLEADARRAEATA